jgi:hypothetical protein
MQKSSLLKLKTLNFINFSSKLFNFDVSDADKIIAQQINNPNYDEIMKKGFKEFLGCLDNYTNGLAIESLEKTRIKIFGSVVLKNGAILRAINRFHNHPWFSDIAINMDIEKKVEYQSDSSICYAKVGHSINV